VLGLRIKNCPVWGVWGNQQPPYFILGSRPYLRNQWTYRVHISESNGARMLIFGTSVGTRAPCKKLSAKGSLENQEPPLFVIGPPQYL